MSDYFTAPADVGAGAFARSGKINEIIQAAEDGFDALPAGLNETSAEITAARDGESSLLAKEQLQDTAILAVTGANGSLISSNDDTPGFLNSKLVATGNFGITKTINNPGANETLGIDIEESLKRSYSL